jgi:hypothetical protein
VEAYPPLVDKKGSYTAQFEHVSQLRELSYKTLLTRPDDLAPAKREGGN